MGIHKKKRVGTSPLYITTAFKKWGFLEVSFGKCWESSIYAMKILLKPSCLLRNNTQLFLSLAVDYKEIERRFNYIMDCLNADLQEEVLPHFSYWKVLRIDYAIDLLTPHVRHYIKLFSAGFISKSFKNPEPYQTSYYVKSKTKRLTYNVYDKINQVKTKHGYSDDDIRQELGFLPSGILRIEIQCSSKMISYLKTRHNLKDSSIGSLWNEEIAYNVLKQRISAIVGKQDFYPYSYCVEMLGKAYKTRTCHRCLALLQRMMDPHTVSLQDIKESVSDYYDKVYPLIQKIRYTGINPIPLDVCLNRENLDFLENPYNLF